MEIFLLTWNLNGKKNFIKHVMKIISANVFNIGIIALQESRNYMLPWFAEKYFLDQFFSNYKYKMFVRNCGLLTIILSNTQFKMNNSVISLNPSYINKGAIISDLKFPNFSLFVINLHLIAHSHNNSKRINQLRKIYKEIEGTYHYLFFLGDFNTRIINLKTKFNIDTLLFSDVKEFDQMQIMKENFKLSEFSVKFPPTYKIALSSPGYNKNRVPSWCDRILYKSPNSVFLKFYKSVIINYFSDHYPVIALFKIEKKPNIIVTKIKHIRRLNFSYIIQFMYNNFSLIIFSAVIIGVISYICRY